MDKQQLCEQIYNDNDLLGYILTHLCIGYKEVNGHTVVKFKGKDSNVYIQCGEPIQLDAITDDVCFMFPVTEDFHL